MIDALIKHVSVTYKCYEMYVHRGKKVHCSCFEIDQEMDTILLIIGILADNAPLSIQAYKIFLRNNF
jgi:hypothetical protein